MDLLYKDESYRIMGACFEVYSELGCGFLEPVYQQALAIEFGLRNVPCRPKVRLEVRYKDRVLDCWYEPDFVCFESIIVEIKAVSKLNDEFRAQVHNYLKAAGLRLGLLVNFGHHPKLQWERIIR